MRELAEELLAIEEAAHSEGHTPAQNAGRVYEKLRGQLTRFAGVDGFTSLFRRALAVARIEIPALECLQVKGDGSIEGFEAVSAAAADGGHEAAVVLTANLLTLLATFIGEPLTRRLVKDAWPDEIA